MKRLIPSDRAIHINTNQEPEYILVDKDSQLRCPNPDCRKLLGKGTPGAIEIKCPRCKTLCRFKSL